MNNSVTTKYKNSFTMRNFYIVKFRAPLTYTVVFLLIRRKKQNSRHESSEKMKITWLQKTYVIKMNINLITSHRNLAKKFMQNLIVYQFTALRWSVSQICNALELDKKHVTDVHKQNHPKLYHIFKVIKTLKQELKIVLITDVTNVILVPLFLTLSRRRSLSCRN